MDRSIQITIVICTFLYVDAMYTPEYCQKRCTTLRELYVREQREKAKESKSGSGRSRRKGFPFFQEM